MAKQKTVNIGDLHEQIDAERANQRKLKTEKDRIASLWPPIDVAEQRLDAELQAAAAAFDRRLDHPFMLIEQGLIPGSPASVAEVSHEDTTSFIAWALGDQLREKLHAAIRARYPKETMADGEKSARLRALDEKILKSERTEEELLEQLEAVGIRVQRRGDMDVCAFLGVE